ncbi:restriction endonuclease subunit S [Nocardioides sp. CER19]|uniref:restriction endonuclease subunit S n=1 Tax=Nocardioides sp. CER19 TaxID=3038538 RepID=UPI00244C3936|nr:restriction endonuclease subunit S [Nocardioides sp. CER19]MDH2414332.1 restriction endonuclease subunit S [Nocardioides sp. CER19]
MSYIDQLIAKHCPDGVEFRFLREVAPYATSRVDASALDPTTFVGVDNLLPDKGGRIDASHDPNTDRLAAYAPGDVLIGNIRPYLKKIWLADRSGGCSGDVLALHIAENFRERITPEFLYYAMSSDDFFAYNMRHAKGAKMPRGSKEAILAYKIPVPPLVVQREITSILNVLERATTRLAADLAAESQLRSQQHALYRGQALDSVAVAPTALVRDVVDFFNAKAHEKLVDPAGTVALMTARFVSRGEANRFIRPEDVLTPAYTGDVALVMSDLPNGKALARTFYVDADGKYAANQRVGLLRSREPERLLPRFLRHVMDRNPQLLAYNNGMDQTHLKKDHILDVRIPVPSIEDQTRVVTTIDALDSRMSGLSTKLEAEISARQMQYEYYSAKLLTFEEAA